jgi:Raf kinase inhibitor-like YbhB/YbcL family protein
MTMPFSSPSFLESQPIPKRHAGDGENLSPALSWQKTNSSIQSYSIIVEDPDAPSGTFIHWVIYNISADINGLPEGLPVQSAIPGIGLQGMNDIGQSGYYGPCPPAGKPHRYFFKIFALDRMIEVPKKPAAFQLYLAMKDHILDQASLMGTYRRV